MNSSTTTKIRRYGRFALLVLSILMGTAGLFLLTNSIFEIHTIEVVGERINVVVDYSHLTRNLLFFPSDRLEKQLLSENPLLARVEIHKKFPHSLIIVAVARLPLVRLVQSDHTQLLDKDGVVLPDDGVNRLLPQFVFDLPNQPIGETVRDEKVQTGLRFLALVDQSLTVSEITAYDSASIRVKAGIVNIYIPQSGTVVDKVNTLQTLLAGFRIKGTMPAVIDLRFDKPVVTF